MVPLLGFPGSGLSLEDPNKKCAGSCWLWITADSGFFGDDWIICGPAQLRDLSRSEREDGDWDDSIESLHTGTSATVHAWVDEHYSGTVQTFSPNSIYRSLEDTGPGGQDMDGEISSLQLECAEAVSDQD